MVQFLTPTPFMRGVASMSSWSDVKLTDEERTHDPEPSDDRDRSHTYLTGPTRDPIVCGLDAARPPG
jgi:hypothetical protein